MSASERWIVVADMPFVPARGGGEREHLGFVEAAVAEGRLAALVVPTDHDPAAHGRQDDLDALAALVAPAPLVVTHRRRGVAAAVQGLRPYVVASRPAPANLVDKVATAAPDATAVVLFSYKSHQLGRALAEGLGLPAVLRHHNLEGPYHRSLAAASSAPKRYAVAAEAWRIDRDERRLESARWLSGIADISSHDARIRAARSRVPVRYVPTFALGPDAAGSAHRWQPTEPPTIVFVGSLEVGTNADALHWFGTTVWPQIRAARPDVRWHIVGRRPTDAVRQLAVDAGAHLHADVPDPGVHLAAATVAVNPAVSGSGVNIKLVEYLSVGVPVVSTTRGVQGLGLVDGQDLLVADSAAGFTRAVCSLLDSESLRGQLGDGGRRTALRTLDARAGLEEISRLLAQL